MRIKAAVTILIFLAGITAFATFKTVTVCGEMQQLLQKTEELAESGDFPAAHEALQQFRALQKRSDPWLTAFVDRTYRFELRNNCASLENYLREDTLEDFFADSERVLITLDIISDSMVQVF